MIYLLTWDYQIIENLKIKQETMFLNNLRVISYLPRDIHEWSIYFNLFLPLFRLGERWSSKRPTMHRLVLLIIDHPSMSLSLSLNFFFHSSFTTSEKTRINQNWKNARILIAFAWFFAILEDQLDNASQCFSPCPWNATG